MNDAPEGRVFDLGYRRYDGAREGRARARQALFVNGIRTCFGLGRGAWAKLLPILFFVSVMTPAAFFSVMGGLLGDVLVDIVDLPGHEDYYGIVSPILFIFAAIIAPELLCPDRRERVIDLYLVRPMTATDYVLGRWSAFFLVSVAFIYSGQLLLLAGLTLGAEEPLEYLRENWLDIPRFLAAGLAIAVITTTIPLAAASLTTRRAYASAGVIGLFVLSSVVSGMVANEGQFGEIARWARLIDIGGIQTEISDMIFGEYESAENLPRALMIAWYTLIGGGAAYALWWRYRSLAR